MTDQIRPSLSHSPSAVRAVLIRDLYLDEDGRAVFEGDGVDAWEYQQDAEPQKVAIADGTASLISESIDGGLVRAAFEIESFCRDTPIGPTQPRMGDYLALDLTADISLIYRVHLTAAEVAEGVDVDLAPGELLLVLLSVPEFEGG